MVERDGVNLMHYKLSGLGQGKGEAFSQRLCLFLFLY